MTPARDGHPPGRRPQPGRAGQLGRLAPPPRSSSTRSGPVDERRHGHPQPDQRDHRLNSTHAGRPGDGHRHRRASTVVAAEGFIDTVGANGTGFPFIADGRELRRSTENVYADIPLTTVNALSSGNHTLYVHGKDAAGNWGATATTTLLVDRTAPLLHGIALTPTRRRRRPSRSPRRRVDPSTGGLGGAASPAGQYWIDGPATPRRIRSGLRGRRPPRSAPRAGGVHTVVRPGQGRGRQLEPGRGARRLPCRSAVERHG